MILKIFSFSEDGTQVAYVAERDAKPKELQKFYKLWYYKSGMDSASMLVDKNSEGMQLGMTISENGNLSFSKSGNRLFFGTAPIQAPKDTTLVDFENAKLDIWHYNDDYLQPVQLSRLQRDLRQNYLAVYHFDDNTLQQLESKEIPTVYQTNEGDGDQFVGVTDFGKRIESQWMGTTKKDIYAINVKDGSKKLVKKDLQGFVSPQTISPTGKYIMWYDSKAKHYFVWDGATTKNITANIKFPLWNEEHDSPSDPPPYGIMKWMENDEAVFIYDRFGAWKVDAVAGKTPVYLVGDRAAKTRYRYVQTDSEERFIKNGQSMVFQTLNEINKKAGLWRGIYSNAATINKSLLPINSDDQYSYSQVRKAKNVDDYIFVKESFTESPDLYYWHMTDEGTDGNKLSSINPQQADYNWGTVELFNWKAYNGKECNGSSI